MNAETSADEPEKENVVFIRGLFSVHPR